MLRLTDLALPLDHPPEALEQAVCARLGIGPQDLERVTIVRRGNDARKKSAIKLVYAVDVSLRDEARVLAAHLHVRSGYGGTDLATMFKIPAGTAYEWLRWFDRLPEGLREAALTFIDREGFMMVVNMPPTVTSGHAQDEGRQSA